MTEEGNQSHIVGHSVPETHDETAALICTWIFYNVVCQIINIFGIVTNTINIVCFAKQGFKDSINVSLLGLAISDLASLVTMCWTCISFTCIAVDADLPFEILDVAYLVSGMPHFAFIRVSSCITAMITLERCLSIVAPLKVKHIITPKRAGIIIVCIFIIFTFSASPIYVVNRLGIKLSPLYNKTLIALIPRNDKEQVEMFTFSINNFLIPLCTFTIVATCTAVLSNQLRKQAKWRLTTVSNVQDDRISNRNLNVAKMVVTISTLFIVCFVPCLIIMLAIAFEPELQIHGKFSHLSMTMAGFTYVMESVNASVNIFIYKHMSFKYRETLRKLFNRER